MKRKNISLAVAIILAAGAVWFAFSPGRPRAVSKPSGDVVAETANGAPRTGQMLRPPEPNRRFVDFTPEQRVEFARKGHGPGG